MAVMLGIGIWPAILAPLGRGYVVLCRSLLAGVPIGHHYPPLLVAFLAPIVIVLLSGLALATIREILAQHRLSAAFNARSWNPDGVQDIMSWLPMKPEGLIVTRDREIYAFCSGLLRPRIYLSRGIIELLEAEELSALLHHEFHHQRRRDPLRLFLVGLLRNWVPIVPVLQSIEAWMRFRTERDADRFALTQHAPAVLASAMLKAMRATPAVVPPPIGVGFSPTDARIAALCGRPVSWPVNRSDLLMSLLMLLEGGVLVVWLASLSLPNPPACTVCPGF